MKRTRPSFTAAALLGAGLSFLAGCYLPPFDVEVSEALLLAGEMDHLATIGPLMMFKRDLEDYSDLKFLPLIEPHPRHGVFVGVSGSRLRLNYIYTLGGGEWYHSYQELELYQFPGSAPDINAYQLRLIEDSAAPGAGSVAIYRPFEPLLMERFNVFRMDTGIWPLFSYDIEGLASTDMGVSVNLQALHFLADSSGFSETLQLFGSGPTGYHELAYQVMTSGTFISPPVNLNQQRLVVPGLFDAIPTPNLLLPGYAPGRAFYLYSPRTKNSYLSTRQAGVWQADRWFADIIFSFDPHQDLVGPLGGRDLTMLTSGEILLEKNDEIVIYDKNGVGRHRFRPGTMTFAHEAYIEGRARLVFVDWLWFEDDGREELLLKVYTIPTSEVGRLDP